MMSIRGRFFRPAATSGTTSGDLAASVSIRRNDARGCSAGSGVFRIEAAAGSDPGRQIG